MGASDACKRMGACSDFFVVPVVFMFDNAVIRELLYMPFSDVMDELVRWFRADSLRNCRNRHYKLSSEFEC